MTQFHRACKRVSEFDRQSHLLQFILIILTCTSEYNMQPLSEVASYFTFDT